MVQPPSRTGFGAALTIGALGFVLAQGTVLAQSEQKQAEATPAAAGTKDSGAAEPLPGESNFKQFKQDLFKPFETWKPGGATQPILAIRPTAPPVSIKQAEAMERERNWVFTGMNELNAGPKRDELRKMSDTGVSRWGERTKSSVEKYYEESGRNAGAMTNTLNDWINAWSRDPTGMNAMNPMSLLIPGSDQLMKKMLLPGDPSNDANKKDSGSTASGAKDFSDDDLEKRQRETHEFKRMMDPTLPPFQAKGFNPVMNPLSGMDLSSRPGADFGTAPARVQLPGTGAPGAMTPVLGVANPPGIALPSMTSGPMKPILPDTVQKLLAEPPKPVLVKPMDPTATMPRRKFQ